MTIMKLYLYYQYVSYDIFPFISVTTVTLSLLQCLYFCIVHIYTFPFFFALQQVFRFNFPNALFACTLQHLIKHAEELQQQLEKTVLQLSAEKCKVDSLEEEIKKLKITLEVVYLLLQIAKMYNNYVCCMHTEQGKKVATASKDDELSQIQSELCLKKDQVEKQEVLYKQLASKYLELKNQPSEKQEV